MSQAKRSNDEAPLAKIRALPPARGAEVEDFVDFLRVRDEEQRPTHAATKPSAAAFAKAWESPDDADNDRL